MRSPCSARTEPALLSLAIADVLSLRRRLCGRLRHPQAASRRPGPDARCGGADGTADCRDRGHADVIPVCRLARRVWDWRAALAAAFFLAVAVLHVRDSHFAMTDVLMTLFVMLSLPRLVSAIDAVSEEPSTGAPALRGFAAAGLLAGLATSTKYNAAALVVSMMAVQLLLRARSSRTAWSLRAWTPVIAFTAAAVEDRRRHAVLSPRCPWVPGRLPLRPDAPVGAPRRRRRSRVVCAPHALAALWMRRPDVRRGDRRKCRRAAPSAVLRPRAGRVALAFSRAPALAERRSSGTSCRSCRWRACSPVSPPPAWATSSRAGVGQRPVPACRR